MLKSIGQDIWVEEREFAMGLIDFGARMTVIRLSDGGLLLYSPVEIDDALAGELKALGEVKHILAPNAFHYLFVETAKKRYPEATVYGTRALAKKRPALPIDEQLVDEAPASWSESVDFIRVDGAPKMDEVVLYHRASGTLVICDLVFHFQEVRGWFGRFFFRMLGVFGRVQQSPLWRFVLTKDRAAAETSLRPIWAWDIERVVMSHGRIIEGSDAKARLAGGLSWMCATHAHPELMSETS